MTTVEMENNIKEVWALFKETDTRFKETDARLDKRFKETDQKIKKLADLFTGQSLGFISFWILISSSIVALLGRKRVFGVTPKGVSGRMPLQYLMPQLLMLILSLSAAGIGIYRLATTSDYAMIVNVLWVLYHSVILGTVFYFNRPFHGYPDSNIFREWSWV